MPDMPTINTHVLYIIENSVNGSHEAINTKAAHSKFLLAHQRVNKKNTASTKLATLLALVSKPQVIKQAPINEDPR